MIFLLHSHNEYHIHCSFPGTNPNYILLKKISVCIRLSSTLSTIFMACSSSFTPLYDPQLSFKDRHNLTNFPLIRHSSTIQYTLAQFHHHLTPISPLATNISALISDGPVAFSDFIFCIASTISLRAHFSHWSFYYISFHHVSHLLSSFKIFSICSFQTFAFSLSIKANRPSLPLKLNQILPLLFHFSKEAENIIRFLI